MVEHPIVRFVRTREARRERAVRTPVEALYVEHHQGLVQLASLLTNGSADSEDLVQDVFAAFALRHRSVAEPLPYLRRAVTNAAIGRHRKRGREVTSADPPPTPPSPAPDDAAIDRQVLLGALTSLPERQRIAVLLRHSLQWSEAEVAAAMGCRVGTASSLAARGRAALRAALEAAEPGGAP